MEETGVENVKVEEVKVDDINKVEDLATGLQTLALQEKVAVSMEKTEPDYVMGLAAQHINSIDSLMAATSSNYSVRLFTRSRLAQKSVLTGHGGGITGIQFLHMEPDILMTSSQDKTVRIWDQRASLTKEVQRFEGEDNTHCRFMSCAINTSDTIMCAGTAKTDDETYLLFWDRRKRKLLGCYEDSHSDDITQVHFHPMGEMTLLTGSMDGLLNVFDIMQTSEDDALLSTYNTESTVERAGWCGPNSNHVYSVTHMASLHVWDTVEDDSIQQVTDLTEKLKDKCEINYLIDYIPVGDEARLVAGTTSGSIHILDLTDPEEVKVVKSLEGAHSEIVRCLHWDKLTESMVTGGEDSMLCLWSPHGKGVAPVQVKQGKIKDKVTGSKRATPYSR